MREIDVCIENCSIKVLLKKFHRRLITEDAQRIFEKFLMESHTNAYLPNKTAQFIWRFHSQFATFNRLETNETVCFRLNTTLII